jgi:hypothetical protein
MEEGKTVALTGIEILLISLVLFVFVSVSSLGLGFFLGTKTTKTSEIVDICQSAIEAQEDRVEAIKYNFDIVLAKTKKYEDFLINTGLKPTLPIATSFDAQPLKKLTKEEIKKMGMGGN